MKKIILAGVLTLLMSPIVSAHTIALGTQNAGSPGSVTLWLGSYHGPGEGTPNEGSMTLNGTTLAFHLASSTMPTGLLAGTNYFYTLGASCCSGTQGDFSGATNPTGLAERRWQGVTFTGLSAGDYAYAITGMSTAVWRDWNSNLNNWTGTLNIPRGSVGVPEPGTLALLGLGLAGLGLSRRRRQI